MTPRIILIGPPGAGKSSIGARLASKLNVDFHDTDQLIEKSSGKRVSQIFVEDGELAFREIEKNICALAINQENGVLALGGGAILAPETCKLILNSGSTVIFLEVTLKVAAPRIGFNRDRPLLLGNPRQQWQVLMDARLPLYRELATITYEVKDLTVGEVVNDLLALVNG